MVATLIEEARRRDPEIQVEEIDLAEHPAVAVKYGVMSTPAIAVNGRLEFVGVPTPAALLARLDAARRRLEAGP